MTEETVHQASEIGRWAFFFLYADQYEPERLRDLLPGVEFQQAITVIEAIAARTEDHSMYDHREKAQRDYQWALQGAREEGREEGAIAGRIQLLQQLLGQEESSMADLCDLPMSELSAELADLQQQLRSRGG